MIINDFDIYFFLNKKKKIFILLDDSIRSYIILDIIKSFYKIKSFLIHLEKTNDSDWYKYNNSILIFKNISQDFLYKILIKNLYLNKNVLIFFFKTEKKEFLQKKRILNIKEIILIIKFDELNSIVFFLFLKQFFLHKFYYFNHNIHNYLISFLKNDFECLVTQSNLNIKKKMSLLDIVLNNKVKNNDTDFLLNLYKKKYEISLYTYKKSIDYNNLLKNYRLFKKNRTIVLYLLIILDINIKCNNLFILEIILLNFIINFFFKKEIKENNFDKFDIKYITKR